MSELFWKVGLSLANMQVFIPIALVYVSWEGFRKKRWLPVVWFAMLLPLSMVTSKSLQHFFQVPLVFDPTRYGFPSSHTQFAVVFYGWIWHRYATYASSRKRIISLFMLLAILGFATSAIAHYGYHTWFDIVGGILFGCILLEIGRRTLSRS